MAEDQQKPLRVIGGFELDVKIGQGGMGTVFKARQVSLDRTVAVKILPPSVAKDAKFIDRFQKEARATAKLNHPNIVQGIDVGQDAATGLWYFAMEYIDGPSLKAVLKEKKTLPEAEALEIAKQVARALECAKANGFVHRDVKPDNILLNSRHEAKLADLGLARQASDERQPLETGEAVGTPYYMAPEQARGAMNEIDIRTDIYALGCTLFHLVTGEPPFTGAKGSAILVKHLTEKPPLAHQAAPNVSEACGRLIERMMQKEREKRIQTPTELVAQIEKVIKLGAVAKQAQQAKSLKIGEPAPHTSVSARLGASRTQRSQAPSGLVALVFIAVLGGALWWFYKQSKPAAPGGVAAAPTVGQQKTAAVARPNPLTPPSPAPKDKPALRTSVPKDRPVALPPVPKDQPVPPQPAPGDTAAVKELGDTPPGPEAKKVEAAAGVESKTGPEPPATPDVDPAAKKDTAAVSHPQPAAPVPPQPAGPDPLAQIAHARFLSEMTQRTAKDSKDLSKVLVEMRELADKPEFARAKDAVAGELKDLERVIALEETAAKAMAAAKGELELPADMAKLAGGAKTGKIVRYDRDRGLFVSVGGVEVPVATVKVPARDIVEAAGANADAFAVASYYLLRGAPGEAKALMPALPEKDRARLEGKLEVLKVGAAEAAAQDAYRDILLLIRMKQWPQLREKIVVFEAVHGQTGVGMQRMPLLAAYKEFAERGAMPPLVRLFHAKSGKLLPGGYLQLAYDFSSPDQLQDFACDHGALALEKGWLKVPPGGEEFAQARFIAPLADLRALEVTGKALRAMEPDGAERFGVYVMLPGATTDGDHAPRCICRIYNTKPHLECWDPPYLQGRMNTVGPKDVNWNNDTVFLVDATAGAWKWSVDGVEIGQVKLPAAAVGGRVAFVSVNGNHVWRDLKLIFKPDAAWVKSRLGGATSAPPPLKE